MNFISYFHNNRFQKWRGNRHSVSYNLMDRYIINRVIYMGNHLNIFMKFHISIHFIFITQNSFFLMNSMKTIEKQLVQMDCEHRPALMINYYYFVRYYYSRRLP